MPLRFPKFSRTTSVLLGFLAALGIVSALFDWNWFRHPLERALSESSHREIRIGDLQVHIGFSLEPTVLVRDVYVENAPWADKRAAAIAGEASFTFSLKSVWEGRPVISRLVLKDAVLDMERQADGLRNWRLRNPEDRGPGRTKVLRLEAHRTTIRFVRRDIGLDVTAVASPAQTGADGAEPDASYPTRIDFRGVFAGKAFSGEFLTGERLTFLETRESFLLRGHASAATSQLDVDGSIADLLDPSAIDAKVRLAGHSLSQLHSFLPTTLPASRPYEFESRVRLTTDDISLSELQGKIGHSDLAGAIRFDRRKERTMVRAVLHSDSVELADVGSLVGLGPATGTPAAGRPEREKVALEAPEPAVEGADPDERKNVTPKRLFSTHAFNAERLNALDAHVILDVGKLNAAGFPSLESLRVTADLDGGVLALKRIDIGLAGGHIVGLITLNGQLKPPAAHARMEWKDVRLEKLVDRPVKGAISAGPLNGHIDLKGRGDSVARLFASVSGSMNVGMEGGGISNLLDARLGLNRGKVLRLLIAGDGAIGINNAIVAFDFDKGLGKSTAILLDTDQTHTEGTGLLDLHDETVDLLLTPHPKKPGLFSLHKTIHVHGPILQPTFLLIAKQKQPKG